MASRLPLSGFRFAAPGFAPSKPHRPECPSPSDHDFDFHSSHSLTNFLWFQFQVSVLGPASHSRTQLFLFPGPYSLIPLSKIFQDQALDRLVSSSSIRYRTSTDDLSTLSSSRGLTCFHSGNSILWVGFTLRCLQRLSLPHFASLLCHWHDNSCTRGASIPVLSY